MQLIVHAIVYWRHNGVVSFLSLHVCMCVQVYVDLAYYMDHSTASKLIKVILPSLFLAIFLLLAKHNGL